jgi:hypothetical protein
VPPVDVVRCLLSSDFGEGSSRRPVDMLPPVGLLDAIIRRTILPRSNFRDRTTRLQQWLLSHLVRGIAFDIWDLMLYELEDTIYESFSAKRHMNYTHWISFLIYMGVEPMPTASVQEWSSTTFEYPIYDFSQLVRTVTATPVRASRRPVVPEIAAQ